MSKRIFILIALPFFVYQTMAQIQDPNNAVQLSSDFDQAQGRLIFYSDNKDFCDYYLYIFFVYSEGFEGMSSGSVLTVGPGRRQIKTYSVKSGATRYSYNYQYAIYRGDFRKKTNIDFVYALPVAPQEWVTARITENQEGYQLNFDTFSDTIYACRGGVMCDDNLNDNTAKGYKHFNDNRNMSQITLYHSDGSFGEYVFKGKSLIYPGQKIKMGSPIAVSERHHQHTILFSTYFLDKNKLKDRNIGNKHTHFRPFFQVANEGKTRMENGETYFCEYTDEMRMQEMTKREKKAIPTQGGFKIQDPENHFSKKEKPVFERAVNYEAAFYNRIFPNQKHDFSDIKFTVIPNQMDFGLYLMKLGIKAPKDAPGIYILSSRELVVCTAKKFRAGLIPILCHELSHAFLHIHSGEKNIPAWLNEALAVYLQGMTYDKKKITQTIDQRYVARVKTLIELKDLDISDFITWDYRKFTHESFSQEGYGYAVGYCMALFLMQQDEENAIAIFGNLIGEKSSEEVFNAYYPGGFSQFEKDFMEYWRKYTDK